MYRPYIFYGWIGIILNYATFCVRIDNRMRTEDIWANN